MPRLSAARLLAALLLTATTAIAQTPAQVETISPTGTVLTLTPTYFWYPVNGATSYTVLVQNTGGVVVDRTMSADAAGCGGPQSVCHFVAETPLTPASSYSWFVRAQDASGPGPWSAPRAIATEAPPAPHQPPLPMAPSGVTSTLTPIFTWTSIPSTPVYELEVQSPTAPTHVESLGGADLNCGTTCNTVLPFALNPDTVYAWRVRIVATQEYPWSGWLAFSTPPPALPPAPDAISPTGTITATSPTFSWASVPGAVSYYLLVQNTGGVAIGRSITPAEAGCTDVGDVCEFNANVRLANTTYNWFVNATNGVGAGPWSAPRTINVQGAMGPETPTPVQPIGPFGSSPLIFVWTTSPAANQYRLIVRNAADVQIFAATLTPSEAGCFSATPHCIFRPSLALPAGNYTWMIGAADSSGPSPFATTGFTVAGLAAPAPISPVGTIFTARPDYRWSIVPGATSYEVIVQNTAGVAFNARYTPQEANCLSTCSVTPPTRLANATFNWFVRASNATLTSEWSGLTFTVNAGPAAPILISPTGTISTRQPTYTWNAVAGATIYSLGLIKNLAPVAGAGFAKTPAEAGCPGNVGICSATETLPLMDGTYVVLLGAQNEFGYSENPPALPAFTVATAAQVPAAPVQLFPTGNPHDMSPTFGWEPVPGATSYYLLVQNTVGVAISTVVTASEALCASATSWCTYKPSIALPNATYAWFVNATNTVGTGPWSAGRTFTVGSFGPIVPPTPTLRTPSGTIDTVTPRYLWNPSVGATSYELLVQNTAGVAANITVVAEVAGCPSGTCSITPPGSLTNGATYNWFVRASNSVGPGMWSPPNTITVSALGPGIPAAPVLIGPSGNTIATPLFVWNEVSNATGYTITVQNTAGVVFYQTIGTLTCTASATCAAQPPGPLPAGTYNWFVKSINSYGESAWSAPRTITIP